MKIIAAATALVFLAGCNDGREIAPSTPLTEPAGRQDAPAPVAVKPDASTAFRFRSEDGGWGGAIIDERIFLDSPSSAGWYSSPIITRESPPGGTIYRTGSITLIIEDGGCEIAELRAVYPDRVFTEWDGGRWAACGGRIDAPETMIGTTWKLDTLEGVQAPSAPPAATLRFSDSGALGGTIVCNDAGLGVIWTPEGGFVQTGGDAVRTQMGCNNPQAEQFAEYFWEKMQTAERWRREGNELTIEFSSGEPAKLTFLR